MMRGMIVVAGYIVALLALKVCADFLVANGINFYVVLAGVAACSFGIGVAAARVWGEE